MIEVKLGNRENMLEVRFRAPVTDEDYEKVLIPAIDDAIARANGVRLLARIDASYSDFTIGALWDDTKLGMSRWSGFERIAVVAKSKSMGRVFRTFSVFMPCPVAVFDWGQEDEARLWLIESLGTIHQRDLGGGALQVELLGKIDDAVYEEKTQGLNAFIRQHDRFRLLLALRQFDGWQGLSAMAAHFRLVRDHVDHLEKAAIVGDEGWQKVVVGVVKRLIGREARFYEANDFDAAKAWITDS